MTRYGDAAIEAEIAATTRGQDERVFASRREQMATLLGHHARPVTELAQALGLTDNEVPAPTAQERNLGRYEGAAPGACSRADKASGRSKVDRPLALP